jgi:hypothetical protein
MQKHGIETLSLTETTWNKLALCIFIVDPKNKIYSLGTWWSSIQGRFFIALLGDSVVFFDKSFFIDYAKSVLNADVPIDEAAEHYLLNNGNFSMVDSTLFKDKCYDNESVIVSEGGVNFGIIDKDNILTFSRFCVDSKFSKDQRRALGKARNSWG